MPVQFVPVVIPTKGGDKNAHPNPHAHTHRFHPGRCSMLEEAHQLWACTEGPQSNDDAPGRGSCACLESDVRVFCFLAFAFSPPNKDYTVAFCTTKFKQKKRFRLAVLKHVVNVKRCKYVVVCGCVGVWACGWACGCVVGVCGRVGVWVRFSMAQVPQAPHAR